MLTIQALNDLGGGRDAASRLGEALFHLADAARMMDIDPEMALNQAINRFIERFERLETLIQSEGKAMDDVSPEVLRTLYWNSVKL